MLLAVRGGLVIYGVYVTVTVNCMCTRRITEILVFNENCLECRLYDVNILFVFRNVYIDLTEAGNNDLKEATLIDVHGTLSRNACMILAMFSWVIISIGPAACDKTKYKVSHITLKTTCWATFMYLGSRLMGVTESAWC